ncbi:hypothetical protein COLO4_05884 [Corchorus olitorius]|uniref:Uncharacterized protein n=1 Tax=Corchorus olitorius TaxID=93759 RepID=A0A1R3KPK8_9ROSI|nr:hypothetical protein COLO4_05884 [Corchorus olitorius]
MALQPSTADDGWISKTFKRPSFCLRISKPEP